MVIYERITFLIVAGTLGLFVLAFVFGIWGAVLTLYPGFAKKVSKAVVGFTGEVRSAYAQARELAIRAYVAIPRGRLQARS